MELPLDGFVILGGEASAPVLYNTLTSETRPLAGNIRHWRLATVDGGDVRITNIVSGEACSAAECFREAVAIDLDDKALYLVSGADIEHWDTAFGKFDPMDVCVKALGSTVSKAKFGFESVVCRAISPARNPWGRTVRSLDFAPRFSDCAFEPAPRRRA